MPAKATGRRRRRLASRRARAARTVKRTRIGSASQDEEEGGRARDEVEPLRLEIDRRCEEGVDDDGDRRRQPVEGVPHREVEEDGREGYPGLDGEIHREDRRSEELQERSLKGEERRGELREPVEAVVGNQPEEAPAHEVVRRREPRRREHVLSEAPGAEEGHADGDREEDEERHGPLPAGRRPRSGPFRGTRREKQADRGRPEPDVGVEGERQGRQPGRRQERPERKGDERAPCARRTAARTAQPRSSRMASAASRATRTAKF